MLPRRYESGFRRDGVVCDVLYSRVVPIVNPKYDSIKTGAQTVSRSSDSRKTTEPALIAIAARADRVNRALRLARERTVETRLAEVHEEIGHLVASFHRADPSIRAVILFGSVARGVVRRVDFDVDIAVDTDSYFKLVEIAERSDFPIDLIDLTYCSPYVRYAVETDGVELYPQDMRDKRRADDR